MNMKRMMTMLVAAGAALTTVAMPTRKELAKAQEMVSDVTAADVAALKAKSKTPAEVAAKHVEFAGQSSSEAEKYLLLQAAFKLYAKAGDYDGAANVIEKLQAEITDYNPEVTVELCSAEFIRKMRENAPRLYALKENARRIVFYRKQLPIREAAVKKNPKDPQAQRKLAECHAELGDWPKALEVFVKAGGEFKKMSEGETSGKVPTQELGDFWWDYETKSDTQVYKLHAAELYRAALANDSFKGLARTRAEQRVKEVVVDLPHPVVSTPAALDAASLAHRWSFTKDFIDSVGKVEAKKIGENVELKDGQCVMEQGGLKIDDVLPKDGDPFTVELWYTETKRRKGGYVVDLRANPYIAWVTGAGREGYFVANGKTPARGLQEMNFELNHKYLLAITYDGRELITAYKFDLSGKGSLHSYAISDKPRHVSGDVRLGTHCESKKYGDGIYACFDEVRIWRVCKSEEDIEATIKAGPDRVVMPKAKAATTSASVSAPSSTSRPAPMTFDLAKDVKLEMLGCPAGVYKKGYGTDEFPFQEVKITRPFWLGKYKVTRRQWQAMGMPFSKGDDGQVKYAGKELDQCAVCELRTRVEQFLCGLNEKFRGSIPQGYVFRLASDAEWEYAHKAGDYVMSNPAMSYGGDRYEDYRKPKMWYRERGADRRLTNSSAALFRNPLPVGMGEANAWGFYDMLAFSREHVLDRMGSDCLEKAKEVRIRSYEKDNLSDPLEWKDEYFVSMMRAACGDPACQDRESGNFGTFRVCLGPDIVAEKKAKK